MEEERDIHYVDPLPQWDPADTYEALYQPLGGELGMATAQLVGYFSYSVSTCQYQ